MISTIWEAIDDIKMHTLLLYEAFSDGIYRNGKIKIKGNQADYQCDGSCVILSQTNKTSRVQIVWHIVMEMTHGSTSVYFHCNTGLFTWSSFHAVRESRIGYHLYPLRVICITYPNIHGRRSVGDGGRVPPVFSVGDSIGIVPRPNFSAQ